MEGRRTGRNAVSLKRRGNLEIIFNHSFVNKSEKISEPTAENRYLSILWQHYLVKASEERILTRRVELSRSGEQLGELLS